MWRADCDYVPENYPGTGDLFAAVLTGGLLKGDNLPVSVSRAAGFTQKAVKATFKEVVGKYQAYHNYGMTVNLSI